MRHLKNSAQSRLIEIKKIHARDLHVNLNLK
jgi:hypothetical protein